MRRRGRDSFVVHRFVGVALAATLFIFLPVIVVAGVINCTGEQPGLHCSIVKFALDDGLHVKKISLR